MKNQDFTTSLVVDQTPREVFNAVTNVRGWWSEAIQGGTEQLDDEFVYEYADEIKADRSRPRPESRLAGHRREHDFYQGPG